MSKRGIALLAALAALTGGTPQQAGTENCVGWAKSWEEAKVEAQERNVPIFFTIQQDENPGSMQMISAFRDNSFIAESRKVVCVVANPDTKHGVREIMVNKVKTAFCRIYDGMPCDVHVRCQSAIGHFFKEDGNFQIPTQIWARPDGTEIFKQTALNGLPQSASALIKDMDRALERISGPRMSRKEWEDIKKMLREGDEAQGRNDYKIALVLYKKVMDCKFDKFARIGKDRYESHIRQCVLLVGKAVKQYEKSAEGTKEKKEVKPLLQKIAKEMKGTEAGDAADKALKELK